MTDDPQSYPMQRSQPLEPRGPVLLQAPTDGGDEDAGPSPLMLLRRALHGRYIITGVLCAVLAGAGGVAGWMLPTPRYKSTGAVVVNPKSQRLIYAVERNEMPPMFPQFVASQAALLGDYGTVKLALESAEWRALGRRSDDATIYDFMDHLETLSMRDNLIVSVEYLDVDPEAAAVGIRQLIKAFLERYNSNNAGSDGVLMTQLEQRRDKLTREIGQWQAAIDAQSDGHGAEMVTNQHSYLMGQRNQSEANLTAVRLKKASLEAQRSTMGAGGTGAKGMDEETLRLTDAHLDGLCQKRASLLGQMDKLVKVDLAGSKDTRVMSLKFDIDGVEQEIATRIALLRGAASGGAPVDPLGAQIEALKVEEAGYAKTLAESQEQLDVVGRKKRAIDAYEQTLRELEAQLADTKTRMTHLDVENALPGRIWVMNPGTKPIAPFNDKRYAIAAGVGFAGFLLGFGTMVLIGLSNQRVRHIVDVDQDPPGGRFLGILPDLPQNGGDDAVGEEERGVAEHCVHNVRTQLQLRLRHRGTVAVVTSATAGAGKTTLTMALGLSYGMTGSRTLLVDADLVGRGLTSSLKSLLRQRVLRLLESGDAEAPREGAPAEDLLTLLADAQKRGSNAPQLAMDELFDRARRFRDATGERSAEIQRLLQALQGQEVARDRRAGQSTGDIRRIVLAGTGVDARSAGLLEALCGAPLRDCVVRTGVPNLHVLTAGGADARDAGTLSPDTVATLLNAASQEYDHVVIDTGPILGSLEASIVCAAADAVLLTVARGDARVHSTQAIDRLLSIGARLAGIVFNRAEMGEVKRSNFSSQWRSDRVEVL